MYTLRVLSTTKFKQSTNQSIDLPPSDLLDVEKGRVFPISSYAYQEGHIKFSLGLDADGKQMSFQGKNTWYAWLGAVELQKDGKPVAVHPPVATKVGSHMQMVPSGKKDAFGGDLYILSWISNGKELDWVYAVSGQPGKRPVHRSKDFSGSMRPCPAGTFSLGPVEFNHWGWGEGLGKYWISVHGTAPRNAIGIHEDANRSYAPGSAGCICPLNESDMRRVCAWRDAGASRLVVDYKNNANHT